MPDSIANTKSRKFLNDCQQGKELQTRAFKVKTATIVDATIIDAPSSPKNEDKTSDPKMHQIRKRPWW